MKSLILLILLAISAQAAETPFYVAASQGIYRGTLNEDTGQPSPLTLATKAASPNFHAISPDHGILYATLGSGVKTVADFFVQPDGTLSALDALPSGGAGACHVSVDRTGQNVLVANYDSGTIACFQLSGDDTLVKQTALIQFNGAGPNPKRQTKPYAHSIYADPANKFVYACDLGTDHIWIFQFDPLYGAFTPADPPAAKVPPGSGPRHLAFHPNGKFVYVANEMGHSVTVFARDAATGALTSLQTLSTLLPETPTQGVTTAEIVCAPSGKFLYVSNRGCDTLSVFSIAADGKLALIQSAPSLAQMPRSFALDPTGHWLLVAGQKDNRIVVQKIDPATGRLTATDQTAAVSGPTCVLFQN